MLNIETSKIKGDLMNMKLEKSDFIITQFIKESDLFILIYNQAKIAFRTVKLPFDGIKIEQRTFELADSKITAAIAKSLSKPIEPFGLVSTQVPYSTELGYKNRKIYLLQNNYLVLELKIDPKGILSLLEFSFENKSIEHTTFEFPKIAEVENRETKFASFLYKNTMFLGSSTLDSTKIIAINYDNKELINKYQIAGVYTKQSPIFESYYKYGLSNDHLFNGSKAFFRVMKEGEFFLHINNMQLQPLVILFGKFYNEPVYLTGLNSLVSVSYHPQIVYLEKHLNESSFSLTDKKSSNFSAVRDYLGENDIKTSALFFHDDHLYLSYFKDDKFGLIKYPYNDLNFTN